ncbi:hypothetical protein ABK040_008797 [Willaertia magna]
MKSHQVEIQGKLSIQYNDDVYYKICNTTEEGFDWFLFFKTLSKCKKLEQLRIMYSEIILFKEITQELNDDSIEINKEESFSFLFLECLELINVKFKYMESDNYSTVDITNEVLIKFKSKKYIFTIEYKKYFQNNLIELFLFQYLKFLKLIKNKNPNALYLENSCLNLINIYNKVENNELVNNFNLREAMDYFVKSKKELKRSKNNYNFYLNILYSSPERRLAIDCIGAVIQVAIHTAKETIKEEVKEEDWLIYSISCKLVNESHFDKSAVTIWDKYFVTKENCNYIQQHWKKFK